MSIYPKLLLIQAELKAPKSQYNNFGKYNYRNCEDILETLKPLMTKYGATVLLDDEIININVMNDVASIVFMLKQPPILLIPKVANKSLLLHLQEKRKIKKVWTVLK